MRSKERQLHVLFNCANVAQSDASEMTKDGFELQFGTDVLGMTVLTPSNLGDI